MDQCHLPDPVLDDIRVLQCENTELINRVLELEKRLKDIEKTVQQNRKRRGEKYEVLQYPDKEKRRICSVERR